MFKRKLFSTTLFFLLFAFAQISSAANLIEVYEQAQKSDPVYQSAWQTYLAATQLYPEARAALLPNFAFNGQISQNQAAIYANAFSPQDISGNFSDQYYTLTLSQPIINIAAFQQLHIARTQVLQAAIVFAAAAQDLMIRTATAYFAVLESEDTLRYTQAEKRAIGQELNQTKQRFEVGLDAITSVYNAQASYDLVVAREISDKNHVINTREELRQLTGVYYENLDTLKSKLPLLKPDPLSIDKWVAYTTEQNLNLKASNYGVVIAKQTITENFANGLPVLSANANYIREKPDPVSFISPVNAQSESIGAQLQIPIYQGGLIIAQTRQAKYNYQKAISDRENIYRQTTVSTRQEYNNIIAGISKILADKQSIKSNQSSVDTTQASVAAGTRTIVDLLITQQNLYQAYQILAHDQYAYILDTLKLKQLAGSLNAKDIRIVNSWLGRASQKVIFGETSNNYEKVPTVNFDSINQNNIDNNQLNLPDIPQNEIPTNPDTSSDTKNNKVSIANPFEENNQYDASTEPTDLISIVNSPKTEQKNITNDEKKKIKS
ncbi:MAG: TolC family outer membrane protein [Gammaproteobacteria bacterium]